MTATPPDQILLTERAGLSPSSAVTEEPVAKSKTSTENKSTGGGLAQQETTSEIQQSKEKDTSHHIANNVGAAAPSTGTNASNPSSQQHHQAPSSSSGKRVTQNQNQQPVSNSRARDGLPTPPVAPLDVPTLTMTQPTPVKGTNNGGSSSNHLPNNNGVAGSKTHEVTTNPNSTTIHSTTTGTSAPTPSTTTSTMTGSSLTSGASTLNVPKPKVAAGNGGAGGVATSSSRTKEQIDKDLAYLARHNVCQTLELMVKQLLRDRPDDPTMAICNMLRGGARTNPLRNSGKSLQLPPPPTPTSELDETPAASPNHPEGPSAKGFPLPKGSTQRSATTQQQQQSGRPTQPLSRGGSASQLNAGATLSPTDAAATSSGSKHIAIHPQTGAAIVRPTSSSSAGSSILRAKGKGGGGSSAAGRRDSANPGSTSGATNNTGHRTLERDESTKSEISTFSVNSVDMGEFIAEFRSAHYAAFPGGLELISRNDLAEIVDRVALPLPDIRMLADLFSEIDSQDIDMIKFDIFLARMCYKIQGRYQFEVLKGIFYSMIPGGHATHAKQAAAAAAAATNTHGNGGQRSMPPPSMSTNSLPDEAANFYPPSGTGGGKGLHSSGLGAQDFASLVNQQMNAEGEGGINNNPDEKVARKLCYEEGLIAGLGLRVTLQEFNDICRRLGLPSGDEALLDLSEFLRIVYSVVHSTPSAGPGSSNHHSARGEGAGYAQGHGSLTEDANSVTA